MSADFLGSGSDLDERCVNTIRLLSVDAIEKAASGHPGAPMGLAPAGYVLWTKMLRHNPKNPDWIDRDRFVLSGGHASMLLYSLLHLTGYGVSLDDIKQFRQWGSRTPGHPEFGHTPGVETTTGPLGQGFANAVGMAMAERHLGAVYNRPDGQIVDHHTFVFCGDGDLMEGLSSEAASLAGHLGLGKLICLYDDNGISIEGGTDIAFTEDVAARFAAFNWDVFRVEDGNDLQSISEALTRAKGETNRPSLILLKTHIAFGSPNKQDSSDAHGAPLGKEETRLVKENFKWPADAFFSVPDDALKEFGKCVEKGKEAEAAWMKKYDDFKTLDPDAAHRFQRDMAGDYEGFFKEPLVDFSDVSGSMSTRAASGKALNAMAEKIPALMGGSADLAPSNNTIIKSSHDFQKTSLDGRNIRFGVREHAMGSIMNGMSLHKGLKPFGGTFLVFADYMRPAIRLAALMKLPVIYVFTHDSVAVGEDGPTHQPVEHLASLRAIPGLTVIRPADALETWEAWKIAVENPGGPVALILSRQNLPILRDGKQAPAALAGGARILLEPDGKPDVIIISTGSEVHISLEAGKKLAEKGVGAKVVSMPSWELFDKLGPEERDQIIDPDVPTRLAVEAGIPMGWEKYTGNRGAMIGMTGFGASGPGGEVMAKFGFTPERVVERVMEALGK